MKMEKEISSKKIIIITSIVIIVLLVGAAAYFLYSKNNNSQQPAEETTEEVAEWTMKDGDAEEATNLTAVGPIEGNGSGTATRRIREGKFIHTIRAEIPDPHAGKFYEGWLVLGSTFFSTGKLVKSGGSYELYYESLENKSGYSKVVVTQETETDGLDGVPETHVLEGSF